MFHQKKRRGSVKIMKKRNIVVAGMIVLTMVFTSSMGAFEERN